MTTYRRPTHRRRRTAGSQPFVAFWLILVLGVLFTGCTGEQEEVNALDEAVDAGEIFSEEDLEAIASLSDEEEELEVTELVFTQEGGGSSRPSSIVDAELVSRNRAIRTMGTEEEGNIYRVTNTFVNLRSSPSVTATTVGRLEQGETMEVLEHINAAWAKVRIPSGEEAYVSSRYIAKPLSDAQLEKEKEQFAGLYFVDFSFLNVRTEPRSDSEKIGELPGQSIIRPLNIDNGWARIIYNDREAYVASEGYLEPFLPNFTVRQGTFTLPIFSYRYLDPDMIDRIVAHGQALQDAGVKLITIRDLADTLERQEQDDVRLDPNTAVIAIYDADAEDIQRITDALLPSSIRVTFFIQTQYLGIDGITEAQLQQLIADGFDVQSGGHMNDDLRSLTTTQVEIELLQSKQLLEEYIGDVVAIGYPRGSVNSRVEQSADEIGYLLGIGSGGETTFDRSQLLRVPSYFVSSGMTADDVVRVATGEDN